MADHQDPVDPLHQTWAHVVDELLRRSNDPASDVPPVSHRMLAFLRLAQPITIVSGYVVLATPHQMAKNVVEVELGPHIAHIFSEQMGQPCGLAVSIDPNAGQHPAAATAPATPPANPEPDNPPAPLPPAVTTQTAEAPAPSVTPGASISQPAPQLPAQPVIDAEPAVPAWATTHGPAQPADDDQPTPSQPDLRPARRMPREQPAHDPNRQTSLNPKYTFETFVIGSSNRFANGAAVAVAENPARAYNPLFISGGSGLGKTHLLHAAGHYAKQLQPSLRIQYVSSEEFTNDYINSVRDDRQESFKRRYRNLDILMVDDIQFLQGKEATQEEFFHTFNALHQANKQIILSSDRPPKELTTLEDRLRTRFQAGLIADIQPPDLETRIAILMKKAEADGTRVERDVLELIASRIESSIRELEGALIRVSAFSSLTHEPITMAMAEAALHDIMPDADDVEITPSTIMETTADYFNITLETLCGQGKTRAVAHARQLAMYLCRELTDLSLPRIGEQFGGKDHTTVMYAERKIRKEMQEKPDTYNEIQRLTQTIKTRGRTGA
ncbi:chromosomal replication initiator protein DnaA [Corynebacterium uberis]|uniref:chromosomal replication initiator protein DnaA n=1 Tax=Corynebacterium TaxID=1716 RepID=UPI001D0BA56E|nr:chromosomal replication initiator protein DnaA [Corynebacterium uberis]MCZ9310151.1 chromosomal replication initiator protein DnaA [Corynebacterium sp. c6VSa_13]UDL73292.1 chromosomal replication initiator protein DnaA [Corynebacterium uberis]UDL75830.1 chromosomal replication initiator protein DnaA [Corynebacterium uberis]UDL80325.1 chromosomal replication initiator protein DnaA [Corynebacterium uberis]UDL82461.1 chromosomal replication initiator protein DnaA [Corynebacterium uberis]